MWPGIWPEIRSEGRDYTNLKIEFYLTVHFHLRNELARLDTHEVKRNLIFKSIWRNWKRRSLFTILQSDLVTQRNWLENCSLTGKRRIYGWRAEATEMLNADLLIHVRILFDNRSEGFILDVLPVQCQQRMQVTDRLFCVRMFEGPAWWCEDFPHIIRAKLVTGSEVIDEESDGRHRAGDILK